MKKFAQEMIDDHTKIGEEFNATLTAASITPPAEGLDMSHKAKYAKLRVFTTESGFDASYLSEQLAAHEEAVELFKDHASNDPTPAIKECAANLTETRAPPRNGEGAQRQIHAITFPFAHLCRRIWEMRWHSFTCLTPVGDCQVAISQHPRDQTRFREVVSICRRE